MSDRAITTLFFWMMVTLGAGMLTPCVLLPAWLDYRAASLLHQQRGHEVAALREHLEVLQKQNAHRDDPAYLRRLERDEFGDRPDDPRQTIVIDPDVLREAEATLARMDAPSDPVEADGLHQQVELFVGKYPILALCVRAETRPVLIGLGAGMIVTALVLLRARTIRTDRLLSTH